MISVWVIFVIVGAILWSWLIFHNHNKCVMKRQVLEFQERFPGVCMICSYHRFGIDNGFVNPQRDKWPDHDCIEQQERS